MLIVMNLYSRRHRRRLLGSTCSQRQRQKKPKRRSLQTRGPSSTYPRTAKSSSYLQTRPRSTRRASPSDVRRTARSQYDPRSRRQVCLRVLKRLSTKYANSSPPKTSLPLQPHVLASTLRAFTLFTVPSTFPMHFKPLSSSVPLTTGRTPLLLSDILCRAYRLPALRRAR